MGTFQHYNTALFSSETCAADVRLVFVAVLELDPPQPVPEPVLHQSGPVSGGAGKRLLLEDRPGLRGQADRAGLQEAQAQGSALLQDPGGTSFLQVTNLNLH